VTNLMLGCLYDEFNEKYFGNKLPKDMVVCYNKYMEQMGVTRYFRSRPLYIELNWKLRWSDSSTAMTLLHECVHVSLPYEVNHGPRFQKEMKRLARIGAMRNWW
jgi:SprT-like family